MQALVWWLVPVVAFVVALLWVSIANRTRPRAKTHESLAEHERFRQAMDRQTASPAARVPHPAEGDDDDAAAGGRGSATA